MTISGTAPCIFCERVSISVLIFWLSLCVEYVPSKNGGKADIDDEEEKEDRWTVIFVCYLWPNHFNMSPFDVVGITTPSRTYFFW